MHLTRFNEADRQKNSDRQTGRQVAHYHEVPVQNEALSQEEYADILRIKRKRGNIKYSQKEKSIISGGTNPRQDKQDRLVSET